MFYHKSCKPLLFSAAILLVCMESSPCIDTDDLNDKKDGEKVVNDLHYIKEGYDILGTRFADKAIELIKKEEK